VRFSENNNQSKAIKASLGCSKYETDLIYTQVADGILGLSPSPSNSLKIKNIINIIRFYYKSVL
jgi:hypothetical protein